MNGQKERLMVLDMIAEGKITAEEAEQLFKAMDEAPDAPASSENVKRNLNERIQEHRRRNGRV